MSGPSGTDAAAADPSRPSIDDYCNAGAEVAAAWGIEPTSVTLLNQSENIVLRVERVGQRPVAMRLHRPGYNTLDELESEVLWVRSLGEAGIPVPTAVPLLDGGHYRPIDITAPDGTVEQRQVGVVEWLDGEPLGAPLEDAVDVPIEHFHALGALMARIRVHGLEWEPPSGFVRRRWDAEGFVGDEPLWGRFWDVAAASVDQRAVLIDGRDALRARLGEVSTDSDRFGLIHADLHLGNLMVNDGALTLIDFDDSGWGWYLHEIGVALSFISDEPWFPDARDGLIEGYRTVFPLEQSEVDLLDTFLAVRAVMVVGWLDARPELGLDDHLPGLIDDAVTACRAILP